MVKTLKLILPFEALYGITLCLIKSSIICFYFRIFGNTKSFRISAYAVLAFIICWALSVVLETFLLCRPVAYNWDTSIKGTCGNRNTVYVSAGALNVITDFMVSSVLAFRPPTVLLRRFPDLRRSNNVKPSWEILTLRRSCHYQSHTSSLSNLNSRKSLVSFSCSLSDFCATRHPLSNRTSTNATQHHNHLHHSHQIPPSNLLHRPNLHLAHGFAMDNTRTLPLHH